MSDEAQPKSLLRFIDKNLNYGYGLEFYASGLIRNDHRSEYLFVPGSNFDYSVEFINQIGDYCHESRMAEDIIVSPISEEDYDFLQLRYDIAIETMNKRAEFD